ncbi:2,3-dehydroadipyl-CoA hydratase [bacterium BMS3Bbin10]|nr:2,3-dehydroadipyl-CoA hydratase [bacterium BMS3Bbin10]
MAENIARTNEEVLLREDRGRVALLTLNRPQARNSLSEELLDALQAQIDDISHSSSARVAIITANGPVFCAGHDIGQLEGRRGDRDGGAQYFAALFERCSALMQSIIACPKPVIAAVEGTATAAGCQLVATCDLAVASEDAKFCTPGVHIGLFCSTPAVALARNVSRKHAMEMLLLGEMIPAEDARAFGLINRVVAKGGALEEALKMAEAISSKSIPALAIGKQAFYEQFDPELSQSYDRATRAMVENMMLEDAHEGLGAFLEKRAPRWRDT